jgi:MFS family permease
MPVLFKEISTDLNLSMVQIGTVWGMDPLAGIFVGLPSGLLADRFGIKKTLMLDCILAGIFGAIRGFSFDFLSMAASMFLFGIMVAATPSIVPKVTTLWFSGKQLGLANGLLNVAWSIGAMTATMFSANFLSPWLGGWQWVMVFFGLPGVILGLLWYFTGREPPLTELSNTQVKAAPLKEALSKVIRVKEVWVLGFITLCTWGANMGFIGYLPLYLRDIGWSPITADSAVTALNAVNMIGIIPMVMLSDRTGSRRGIFALCMFVLVTGFALMPFVDGIGIWAVLIFSGFIRSGGPTLLTVMIFENKEVGSTYGGTATGLTNTIAMVGAFLAPPLGNSLADIDPRWPFLFWAGLAFLSLPMLLLLKKSRKKGLLT